MSMALKDIESDLAISQPTTWGISTEGYNHEDSKVVIGGELCGLMLDEDNHYDLSEDRANAWIA